MNMRVLAVVFASSAITTITAAVVAPTQEPTTVATAPVTANRAGDSTLQQQGIDRIVTNAQAAITAAEQHVADAHAAAVAAQEAQQRRAAARQARQEARAAARQEARAAATASTTYPGATPWTGKPLLHPDGSEFSPTITRWATMTLAVMRDLNIPDSALPGILAQMQQESSGDPDVINDWDSNAAAGTPSKGLMQVIAPTYEAYTKPGFTDADRWLTDPAMNVYASLNYVLDRYGPTKFDEWNAGINPGY